MISDWTFDVPGTDLHYREADPADELIAGLLTYA